MLRFGDISDLCKIVFMYVKFKQQDTHTHPFLINLIVCAHFTCTYQSNLKRYMQHSLFRLNVYGNCATYGAQRLGIVFKIITSMQKVMYLNYYQNNF